MAKPKKNKWDTRITEGVLTEVKQSKEDIEVGYLVTARYKDTPVAIMILDKKSPSSFVGIIKGLGTADASYQNLFLDDEVVISAKDVGWVFSEELMIVDTLEEYNFD